MIVKTFNFIPSFEHQFTEYFHLNTNNYWPQTIYFKIIDNF